MKHLLLVLSLGILGGAPVVAQHQHDGAAETFLVEGLRVDASTPPPGSGVGRAGAQLPGGGYLHVVYGKPYKRGREVFGDLVPYDQVWATGAHQATELVVTEPVTVGGEALGAGVYSLFTTPGEESWTLHLNTALGMHMADDYDPAHDVLTVEAIPETLDEAVETFQIAFEPAEGGADLVIRWDQTAVRFPVRP